MNASTEDLNLIGTRRLCEILACSRVTLWRRLESDPGFPRPITHVAGGRLAWRLSTIRGYLERKETEANAEAP
ncbi:MAG: hypothetical protein AAGF48_09175 [Pseudomonadota bacterium]